MIYQDNPKWQHFNQMCRMAYIEKQQISIPTKKTDFQTKGICLHICGFRGHITLLIKSSSLLSRLPLMRPLAGSSECPASSPSALQPVVTKQQTKLHNNRARKETRHRKFKLSLDFCQKYLYEGIWRPAKPKHLDWAKHASLYGGKW